MHKTKQLPNFLEMIPIRNVAEFNEENEKITLLIPKFKSEWMRKWLIPPRKSKYFRIHLDEMGSEVWRLIDGAKNVGTICELLKNKYITAEDPEKQIEPRVTTFLTQLYKNRFIRF